MSCNNQPRNAGGRILFVDDDPDTRELLALELGRRGFRVETAESAERALALLAGESFDAVLTDVCMGSMDGITFCRRITDADPSLAVVVVTAFNATDNALGALRAHAADFVTKPLDHDHLTSVLRRAVRDRRLGAELRQLERDLDGTSDAPTVLGNRQQSRRIRDVIQRVAGTPATVLITGESGTGKELVARSIHERSSRTGRFVAINCAAMPPELLESALFGHVKGAFTDASANRAGLFLEADGGTLFLDEVGEMSAAMQVKLLRVLQAREVRPIGGNETIRFDTRIVCATNRDLTDEVAAGRFREDLFYRINVVPICVPPLRERRSDILPLATLFAERTARRLGKPVTGIAVSAARRLLDYDWPGNVRELENTMARAVTLTRFQEILAEDLPDWIRDPGTEGGWSVAHDEPLPTLEEVQRRHVVQVLRATGGKRGLAAKVLGLSRRTLYRRLQRLQIDG